MRAVLFPATLVILAGCLGDDPVAPASTLNSTASNESGKEPTVGICVIGANSPCNAPQWREGAAGNSGAAPASQPVGTIKIASTTVDAGQEISLDLVLAGATEAQLASVLWSLGDGTTAEGPSIKHAWETAGLYPIAVAFQLRAGGSGVASTILPVRLHEVFAGTVTLGTGFLCAQPGVDCMDHNLTIPAGMANLTASVSPAGPVPPGCSVGAIDPEGTFVTSGATISVDEPAPGAWVLSVACTGAMVAYDLDALGTFVTA